MVLIHSCLPCFNANCLQCFLQLTTKRIQLFIWMCSRLMLQNRLFYVRKQRRHSWLIRFSHNINNVRTLRWVLWMFFLLQHMPVFFCVCLNCAFAWCQCIDCRQRPRLRCFYVCLKNSILTFINSFLLTTAVKARRMQESLILVGFLNIGENSQSAFQGSFLSEYLIIIFDALAVFKFIYIFHMSKVKALGPFAEYVIMLLNTV